MSKRPNFSGGESKRIEKVATLAVWRRLPYPPRSRARITIFKTLIHFFPEMFFCFNEHLFPLTLSSFFLSFFFFMCAFLSSPTSSGGLFFCTRRVYYIIHTCMLCITLYLPLQQSRPYIIIILLCPLGCISP